MINNLKINKEKIKEILKIGTSIILVPTIGTIITLANKWNPFKLNEKIQTSVITTDIDEFGNIKETKSYSPKDSNYIKYYTKWEHQGEKYKREKYTYIITEEDIDRISTIIKEKKDNETIQKELDGEIKKLTKEYEYTSIIQEPNEPYVIARINKIDNTEIVKETVSEHMTLEISKIIIELVWMALEFRILKEKKFFKKIKH